MFFYSEVHWFQNLNVVLLILNAVLCFLVSETRRWSWKAACLFFIVLAVDEYFLLHECLKLSLFKGLHSAHMLDYVMFFYGLAASLSGIYLLKNETNDKCDLSILFMSFFCLFMILATDVFGLYDCQEVEELLEFLGSVLCLVYVYGRLRTIDWKNLAKVSVMSLVIFVSSGYGIRLFLHDRICVLPDYLLNKQILSW